MTAAAIASDLSTMKCRLTVRQDRERSASNPPGLGGIDEEPQGRPRLRGTSIRKDEVLRDSRGRIVDDAYVERAVEDALSNVTDDRQQDKS